MKTSITVAALLALALGASGGTLAGPPPEPMPGEAAAAAPATAPPPAPAPAKDAVAQVAKAAPETRLEEERGGDSNVSTVNNKADLSGVVTGNTAINVVTGNNIIDSGSFANMSGIPMVIQNSGANVLIQNATVVNLQLR
ncbi:hypothetical protein HHL21_01080 [Massilia sp. RP-1-19]|uniref:Periplasmic protein n=1 Tax=Massilia polaris TaxID=2728846 RepID=A0A848HF40_9BURK|nr:hypothetical protein [Massilia polaris]NML59707.1 hypothetical protein [Massilia polaris]